MSSCWANSPSLSPMGAIVLIHPSSSSQDSLVQSYFNRFIRDHTLPKGAPGNSFSNENVREDFLHLLQSYPALEICRPAAEDMDTTGLVPSSSSESSHCKELVPPLVDPSPPGNKYNHLLPDSWFRVETPLTSCHIFSAGICKSMAKLYNSYIRNWLDHCSFGKINPVSLPLTI